jgi:hypothetical protein
LALWKKKADRHAPARPKLEVIHAPSDRGPDGGGGGAAGAARYVNTPVDPPGKTVRQIILGNIFTYSISFSSSSPPA